MRAFLLVSLPMLMALSPAAVASPVHPALGPGPEQADEDAAEPAESSEDAAEASEDADEADEDAAEASEDADEADEDAAEASEDADEADEDAAESSEDADEADEDAAESSEDADEADEDAAESSEDADEADEDAAESSEDADEADEADEDADEADEAAADATGEGGEEEFEAWQRKGIGFGGIPAVNYNSDEGFGFGVIGAFYGYNGNTAPYKWAIDNQIFATTKNVHHHRIIFDILELAGGKLRINGRVKFEASRAEHYCGFGRNVTCSEAVIDQEIEERGLEGDAADAFRRRYYKMRYIMPYAIVTGRWQFRDKPHRIEAFGGWRGNYTTPGDLTEKGPWRDTLYQQDFPEGEQGLVSVLQAGVMFDNRRNEPAPYDGYWVEASIRGSSRYWGSRSDWEYFGFNAIIRTYTPILPSDGHLVIANRIIFDGIIGNTSMQDFGWAGGSDLLTVGGGVSSGRGIRARRFRGRVDAVEQVEARFRFARTKILGVPFDFGTVGFLDVGMTSLEWRDFFRSAPYAGFGGGLRVTMDQNFVIQADVGVSPVEDYSPGLYIETGNTF